MSHTTTRPRRLGRLAAGLTVAAAATATTLLGTVPAYAQTSSGDAFVVLGQLSIFGTADDDVIIVRGGPGTIRIDFRPGSLTAGVGCTALSPQAMECAGVNRIEFNGSNGNDSFRNHTTTPSTVFAGFGNDRMNGGAGNDRLFGGPGDDVINGLDGADVAQGGPGIDSCVAETEELCEKD